MAEVQPHIAQFRKDSEKENKAAKKIIDSIPSLQVSKKKSEQQAHSFSPFSLPLSLSISSSVITHDTQ